MVSYRVSRWWGFVAAVLGIALTSCSTITVSKQEYLHMLCADPDGEPAAVRVTDCPDIDLGHHPHTGEIMGEYERWRAAKPGRERVMLIFHGGLVSMADAVAGAQATLRAMAAHPPEDGQDEFFPIFVNWETGMFWSWVDHMFFVRAGERTTFNASLTSPIILLADFGKAIARYPVTLYQQTNSMGHYYGGKVEPVPSGWERSMALDQEVSHRSGWEKIVGVLGEFVPGLLRPVTSLVVDAAGLPAYRNMRRRGRVLFVRDQDVEDHQLTGAVAVLMTALIDRSRRNGGTIPVTVIAHSMGTSVANELVQRFGHRMVGDRAAFEFDQLVYMGAACSIRDFAETIVPYVRQGEGRHFYNLCLHPYDEQDDRYGWGTLPHGSLLEWIDDFITEQETSLDRTLGKWNNAARGFSSMAWLSQPVRDRIHVRVFARGGGTPCDHGDFNDPSQRFWLREYWQPRVQ